MAKVPTPHEKVGKTPVKNSSAPSAPSIPQNKKRPKYVYCVLCRRSYLKHEEQEHMHSMLHHRELETVLGKDSRHSCQACKESSMGLMEYAEHISTAQHKAKLTSLMSRNVKPPPLMKILSAETMSQILERNKQLKQKAKKAEKKKKKKLKQIAGQRRAEMLRGAASKNTVSSKVVRLEKSKQVSMRVVKQEAHQGGSNNAVVQNKENKVSSLQRHPHQRESTLQNHSEKSAAGQIWHRPHVRGQFTQSAHHLRYADNSSINTQSSKVKTESFQPDTPVRRPCNTQGGDTNPPKQTLWPDISQHDHYNKQYGSATDFTSDNLPQNGAIIFDHRQNESTEQEGPAQPASANRSANAAPIRDVDVSAMLRQIRRALGVREPCRADRAARRQNSEAAVRLAGPQKEQPAGGSVSSSAPASSHSGFNAKPNRMVTVPQGISSVVASDSNGPSYSREREPQGPLESQYSARLTSPEPSPNITRKVRIAHKSSRLQGEKEAELKPTSNKLLSLTGLKSKLSWREMNEQMRKKKQERLKGMPRFGIELANPLSDQETSIQAEDLPLSEGFHWESFPDTPSGAHWTGLPPPPPPPPPPPAPPQDTTDTTDCHTETQSDSQTQPGTAQEGCSSQKIKAVSVKVEPDFEDDNGDLRDHSSANKRKQKVTHDDLSDQEPRGKKKKTKSHKDQDQMDQLLAVSLREEELCHSLQDLDKSLIQARNTLQAAYTEVQRLLLLRQQCTAEVNGLRAKRIEILQGMQGGYLGASSATEKATTSSAAAAVQPRLSPLPSSSAFPTSSSQQPLPTNPPSSISQPHPAPLALPAVPVKKEICQPSAASCNPDTRQVPVNQPVSLFPSDLLPSLLLTSPHLVSLPQTTAVNSLQQLRTTENTNPSPARQQEQVRRDKLNTVRSVREQSDSDSEEETGGKLRPAAEKQVRIFVTERVETASAAALDEDGGNESDDCVEMMEPSNLEVIDIDESDNEETQEPPQKSVSVEFSSAGTQTRQQEEGDERKVQPAPPMKDSSVTPDSGGVIEDEEPSLGAFLDHTGPVHGLQIHEGLLYTCSGDNTARAYSLMSRECLAVFKGHTNKINCLLVSSLPNMPARLYTGSSDQTIRCYSIKSKKCLEQISLSDRVLCLHVAWNILFAGLANGSVASYDAKTLRQLDIFECHGPRGVSCLGTAQEGARRVLLVGSYDSTISVRDAKSGLLLRSLEGHTKTVLCMKVVNDLVFSGSSDTSVHAHNIHVSANEYLQMGTWGELVRIYKGHGHAVTSIVILGKVMVTACLDKLVRVYELQSHDRLQVYGGHSDMVMCMAIHKSVIYTGCYDGSVQAVKLNLMKNYRCWWQNCSLIFGIAEHLVQHLVKDHTNPNLQTVTCRWRGCLTFFATQQSVRQELPEHMKNHGENDSKVQP